MYALGFAIWWPDTHDRVSRLHREPLSIHFCFSSIQWVPITVLLMNSAFPSRQNSCFHSRSQLILSHTMYVSKDIRFLSVLFSPAQKGIWALQPFVMYGRRDTPHHSVGATENGNFLFFFFLLPGDPHRHLLRIADTFNVTCFLL